MYRYKRSVGGDYQWQGYIYFTSLCFARMGEEKREQIRRLCREAGGEYHAALFEFVTTDTTATAICLKHNISKSTLYRIVADYYRSFPKNI